VLHARMGGPLARRACALLQVARSRWPVPLAPTGQGLSIEWFRTRPEATAVVETRRQHYKDVQPHSSLGQRTPTEFKQSMQRRNEESQAVTQGAISL
jgi:hypothetical protein